MRRRWAVLVALAAALGGVGRSLADDGEAAARPLNAYFPVDEGSRRSYVTRTTLDEEYAFRWDLSSLRSTPLDDGAQRALLKVTGQREGGRQRQRQEPYICDPRGVFTPTPEADPARDGYGPLPLLPSDDLLREVDTVWRYDGYRPLPFAFEVLGLLSANDTAVPTEGHYHVLNIAPVETPAGTFPEAVQVTGIEHVEIRLSGAETARLLLRCRRWYVPGIGLVREVIEFLDRPRLGRLTTHLTQYTGLAAAPTTRTAAVERG